MSDRTLSDIIAGLRNGDELPRAESNRIADTLEAQVRLISRLRVFLGVVVAEATFHKASRVRKSANVAICEILKHKKEYKIK